MQQYAEETLDPVAQCVPSSAVEHCSSISSLRSKTHMRTGAYHYLLVSSVQSMGRRGILTSKFHGTVFTWPLHA